MQLSWVLYIVTLSALSGAAALWVERILLHYRRSARWVWMGALTASTGGALGALLFPRRLDDVTFGLARLLTGPEGFLPDAVRTARELQWNMARELPDLAEPLFVTWIAVLAGVAAWLGYGYWALLRRRGDWEEGEVEGRECLISGSTGPAVFGLFRHHVVLPAWVRELTPEQREMVLRHEEEHLQHRDPCLLALAYLALLLFPWNPVLWWQVRRLRLAVEMDCDRRVARRREDRRRYGRLLLAIGRSGGPGRLAAFAGSASQVGARIRSLLGRDSTGSSGIALRTVGAALALSLFVLVPRPILPYRSETAPESMEEVDPTPYDRRPTCLNCASVRRFLTRSLSADERSRLPDRVRVGLQVTGEGHVRHVVPVTGEDPLEHAAGSGVRRAAASLRYEPARLADDTVTVWIGETLRLGARDGRAD